MGSRTQRTQSTGQLARPAAAILWPVEAVILPPRVGVYRRNATAKFPDFNAFFAMNQLLRLRDCLNVIVTGDDESRFPNMAVFQIVSPVGRHAARFRKGI